MNYHEVPSGLVLFQHCSAHERNKHKTVVKDDRIRKMCLASGWSLTLYNNTVPEQWNYFRKHLDQIVNRKLDFDILCLRIFGICLWQIADSDACFCVLFVLFFLLLLYGRSALLLLTTSWSVRKESKNRCPPTMQNPCRMEKRLIVSSGVNLSVNCFFFSGMHCRASGCWWYWFQLPLWTWRQWSGKR